MDEENPQVITTPSTEEDEASLPAAVDRGVLDSAPQQTDDDADAHETLEDDGGEDILQAGEADQVVDDVLADYEEDLVEIVGQDGFERTKMQLLIVGVTSVVLAILLLIGILVFVSLSGRATDQSPA